MSLADEVEAIAALADAERRSWFVWDCLARTAYQWAGHDRAEAIALLRQAIDELAERNQNQLPDLK